MAISGKVGAIYINTSNIGTAFTNEATTKNVLFTRYTITNVTKRYLDKNTAIVVKKNGTTVTSGYTVEYAGGVIVFDSALLGTDTVTVSGAYLTLAQAGGFFSWSLDLETDLSEVTTFTSAGWKENTPTLQGWSASAEAYWTNGDYLGKLGTEVVIVLYTDSGASKNRYEGFGIIASDSIEDAVDGLIEESLEFTGNGQLYYREG